MALTRKQKEALIIRYASEYMALKTPDQFFRLLLPFLTAPIVDAIFNDGKTLIEPTRVDRSSKYQEIIDGATASKASVDSEIQELNS